MRKVKTRLRKAEIAYCEQLQEWLTNPKNEDLPNETVEAHITDAFRTFLQELLQDEDECAEFISQGHIADELEFMPLIFEHFKSAKIYEAICANCEVAFSHKYATEAEETEQARREMLAHMKECLATD